MVEVLRYPFALHGYTKCTPLLYSNDCLASEVVVSDGVSLVASRAKKRSKLRITGLEMPVSNGLLGIPSVKCVNRFLQCNTACVEFDSLCEEEVSHQDLFEQNLLPFGSSVSTEVYVHAGPASLSESGVCYLDERNEEILSKRILKLSRSNKVRAALALYKSMMFTGLKPSLHACNSLLSCILRNGMLDDALEVFEFLKEGKMTTPHTYSLILKAVAEDRGSDAALKMFEELCKNDCASNTFDVIVYNTMISAVGKLNDWVLAENFWRILQNRSLMGTTVTYSLLICLFVRCGKYELALNAYSEMVQNGIAPGDDVLQALIGACIKEGNFDMAFSVFRSMLNGGLKPNAKSCNAVINSLGKAGKPKLAFKVFGLMKSLGHVPDAYTWNSLLCALNQACHHRDALQCFERIRKHQPHILNFQMYNTIMISCQRLGLWEKAVQLLWEMEASGGSVSTSSYNLVIGACEAARKPKVALQVYNHMVHQKCSPDLFTMLTVMRSCIRGSLWDEVDKILNSSAPNVSLYNAAIQGMCLAGRIDLATKVYTKMLHSGLKANCKTRALMLPNIPKDLRR